MTRLKYPEIVRLHAILEWIEARRQRALLAGNKEALQRATTFLCRVQARFDQSPGSVNAYTDFD